MFQEAGRALSKIGLLSKWGVNLVTEITKKITLKDQVYQRIIELIISGKWKTGEIVTEGQMVERFQVSKSPVREALIQLCYDEVLRSIPRCGYQVVQISAKNIHDLTELRLYLELSSLQKIVDNMSLELLQTLKACASHKVETGEKDKWTAWNDNERFHLTLNACAGNAQVTKALERALMTCTRAFAQLYETDRAAVKVSNDDNFHHRIIRALEDHEIYAAHESLRSDILVMEQNLLFAESSQ